MQTGTNNRYYDYFMNNQSLDRVTEQTYLKIIARSKLKPADHCHYVGLCNKANRNCV